MVRFHTLLLVTLITLAIGCREDDSKKTRQAHVDPYSFEDDEPGSQGRTSKNKRSEYDQSDHRQNDNVAGPIPTPTPTRFSAPRPAPTPIPQIQRAAREISLTCDAGNCPDGVGMLMTQEFQGMGICTTFIVGEYLGKTVMATNHHCLATYIRSSLKTCSGNVYVKFPGGSGEGAHCERILSHSNSKTRDLFEYEPDYAFFLVDRKLNRPYLVWRGGKVPDQTLLRTHSVIRESDTRFHIRTQECRSHMGSFLNPYYLDDPHSSLLLLYGCNQPQGTSGSPIVDGGNEVIGILQANAMGNQEMDRYLNLIPAYAALFKEVDKKNISIGTRAGCVNALEIGLQEDHPSCRMTDSLDYDQAFDSWIKYVFNGLPLDVDLQVEEKRDEWILNEMRAILFEGKYTAQRNPRSGVISVGKYHVEPRCLIPTSDQESHITIRVPEWTLTLYSDPAGRIQLELVETEEDWQFEFDANELDERGQTRVLVLRPSSDGGADSVEYSLEYCPQSDRRL